MHNGIRTFHKSCHWPNKIRFCFNFTVSNYGSIEIEMSQNVRKKEIKQKLKKGLFFSTRRYDYNFEMTSDGFENIIVSVNFSDCLEINVFLMNWKMERLWNKKRKWKRLSYRFNDIMIDRFSVGSRSDTNWKQRMVCGVTYICFNPMLSTEKFLINDREKSWKNFSFVSKMYTVEINNPVKTTDDWFTLVVYILIKPFQSVYWTIFIGFYALWMSLNVIFKWHVIMLKV